MVIKKIVNKFVTLKVYAQRGLIYYQLLNSAMIIFIFGEQRGLSSLEQITLLLTSVIVILIIGYYDTQYKILEREQAHFNKENEAMQLVINTVSKTERLQGKILKRLEEIEGKI